VSGPEAYEAVSLALRVGFFVQIWPWLSSQRRRAAPRESGSLKELANLQAECGRLGDLAWADPVHAD
jgi:hypothetical protein